MGMDVNRKCNEDGITFFDRLAEESIEENSSISSGVISNIFGLFRKPQINANHDTIEPTTSYNVYAPTTADDCNKINPSSLSLTCSPGGCNVTNNSVMSSLSNKYENEGIVSTQMSSPSTRQYWMPDSTGKECYQCEERFTTFRRRHHCRLCGQIFCSKCCNIHMPGSALGYMGDLRLCHYCAKVMAQYLPPEDGARSQEDSSPIKDDDCNARMVDTLSNIGATISTVSSGAIMWRCTPDFGSTAVETEDSFTLNIVKPPSLLCVNELCIHHKDRSDSDSNNVRVGLRDEEESGPDWFRNMDPDTITSEKDDYKTREAIGCTIETRFDPLPISSSEVSCEMISERKSSVRTPISPSSKPSFDDDIDRAFDLRAEHLLSYLCLRERLTDLRWKSIILNLTKEIAQTVKVDVARRNDHMNIRSYVHVKKLFVDQDEPDAELVWGVVCNKSVVYKSMTEPLKDASVMIVAGSIEYERVPGRLSTLEPILNQEVEFLAKQVERILSRRPSILLVEGNVSRLALDLLRDAGVRVVVNVSVRVLHRVARSTGADILPSSDAQLIQQNIGFCPHFSQRSVVFKDGRQKLLLVFNECHPDRGCSILLKGSDARELKVVKRILLFLTSVQYSSVLEREFLNMFNVRLVYEVSNCEVCEARREAINQTNEKSDFEKSLISSILTASPFIYYEPPYLESIKGRTCSLIPYFNLPVYHFYTNVDFDAYQAEEKNEVQCYLDRQCSASIPATPRHSYAINGARDASTIDDLNSFRALGGAIFKKRLRSRQVGKSVQPDSKDHQRLRRHDMLDPYVHQRVAVLFGSFSAKSPNAPYFCVRPWVVNMEFYGPHDMTLGEFLTKFCFNKSYECPSSNCEVPMLDHSRKLVYGRVCVEITTQIVVSSTEETSVNSALHGQIFAWNYCDSCKLSSAVIAMNTSVWHLSFGKYLDYIAYSTFSKGGVSSSKLQECPHCFFHEHTHFYSQGNYVASFRVTPIRPYNVQFSPVQCRIVPSQYSKQALLDGVTRIASLADDIIRTAEDRLSLFANHDLFNPYAGTFYTVLRQVVDKTTTLLEEKRKYAEELEAVDNTVIPSNDKYAIKANEALMYIREVIYQLVSKWNDQSTVLAATIRAAKKSGEDSGVISEVSSLFSIVNACNSSYNNCFLVTHFGLERIDDPFPSYLHLGLELQPRVAVVVRDIMDSRGNYRPDIGSVIAYALSTINYENNQQKEGNSARGDDDTLDADATSVLLDEEPLGSEHLEIEFQDNQASYYVKRGFVYYEGCYLLMVKKHLRGLYLKGGKSGSFFYRTQDDRFVVKQMSRFEIQSFVQFAPHYFEYIKTAVNENKLTSLCKVYGVFRVGYKSKTAQMKVDILVMEYLFYKCNVNQVWDLKGSLRNRMAATGKSTADLVLLDENLMKDLWNKQLYIYPHAKAALNQAISNDSHFLSSQHVMDYSLLVGVDETNGELILGIVDYMRTYTLDKKLESWVKIVAIPGAHLPTILSPEMYCTRFSDAIDTYFPVIPDQWTGLGSAVSY